MNQSYTGSLDVEEEDSRLLLPLTLIAFFDAGFCRRHRLHNKIRKPPDNIEYFLLPDGKQLKGMETDSGLVFPPEQLPEGGKR